LIFLVSTFSRAKRRNLIVAVQTISRSSTRTDLAVRRNTQFQQHADGHDQQWVLSMSAMKLMVRDKRKNAAIRILWILVMHSSCAAFSGCSYGSKNANFRAQRVVKASRCSRIHHISPLLSQKKNDEPIVNVKVSTIEAKEESIFESPVFQPLALLLFAQFILFIGVGAVIPAIPLYGQEIGLSQASNGIVISAPAVALLLGAKWGGNFADVARKPAMLLGMFVIAISDLGTALSTNLPSLFLARLGLGTGRCISESGERGMLADLANQVPQLRGRALAAQQAVIALGIAIGAPAGGIIIEEFGPRYSFLCVTAGAVLALILYAFLPETIRAPTSYKTWNENESQLSLEAGEWNILLKDNRWKGLALCQSGASFGFAAKIASIPILATATLPGGAAGAGALISIAGLSGLLGAPMGGWLTDRAGAKVTAVFSGAVSAVGLCLIPVALGSSVSDFTITIPVVNFAMDGNAAAFSALVILWSLGATAQGPALTALAQELAPVGAEATALALPRAAGDGTYIVAPFLIGAVADSFGPGFECAAAGSAVAIGALSLALPTRNENDEARIK
jgi:MFS family permease